MGAPRRRIVIVLGMDRTGTSVLMEVLQSLGCYLGEGLMGPTQFNQRGHFESLEIYRLHEELLSRLGVEWHTPGFDWPRLDNEFWRDREIAPIAAKLSEFVDGQLSEDRIFAFKDPRTARFLSMWTAILRDLQAEPTYILAVRSPLAVARSLKARDGLEQVHSEFLWCERYVQVLENDEVEVGAVINYDDWFDSPLTVLTRLAEKLGREPLSNSEAEKILMGHVIAGLRHQVPEAQQSILPFTDRLYRALTTDRSELRAVTEVGAMVLEMCLQAANVSQIRAKAIQDRERFRKGLIEISRVIGGLGDAVQQGQRDKN